MEASKERRKDTNHKINHTDKHVSTISTMITNRPVIQFWRKNSTVVMYKKSNISASRKLYVNETFKSSVRLAAL